VKKAVFFLILLSLSVFPLFCASDLDSFLISKHSGNVLPVDKSLGQTADPQSTDAHKALSEALKHEYSFEWLETYLVPAFRKTAASIWSGKLSSILPAKQFVMSLGKSNADSSVSISVRIVDSGTVIHFALKDGLIEAIGF